MPGKYLAYEDSGRRVVVPVVARMDADRPLAGGRRALRRRDRLAPSCAHREPRPTAYACSTTARSTASTSTAAASSGAPLTDGDEIVVGRHTIHFLDTAAVARVPPPAPAAARRVATPPATRAASLRALMAETIAVLSLKGGTGKTTTVRTLADVLRRIGLDVLRRRPRPAGQPVGLLRRAARRVPDDRRRAQRRRQGQGGRARRDHPRDAEPGRGRARRCRGKMGRELVLAQGAQGAAQAARRDPDRLPAGARPADDQRARRRRLGADLLRGAVLRAPGRQRRARRHRAGARSTTTPTSSASACCSTSPTCARCTRARPTRR